MKIVFVILHYLAIDETYKSVDSIEKKIDTDMYKIVIVDNASPDKSGALLKEHYKNDDHVEVLLNQENLGFARGNNVGFRCAEKTWNPSYIVLMNNDVYLLDDDFLEKVEKEYKRSQFAVLGPMVLSADGRCDINPIRTNAMSKQEVEHDIQAYKIKSVVYKYHLEKIKNIYRKIKPLKKKKKKEFIKRYEYVQLHGCFMLFSRKYIEKFNGLDDRTFLYREEAILMKHLTENGLNSVYLPDIHVFHREDASTDDMIKENRKKEMFEIKNHLQSLKVLKEVYDFYENKRGENK